MSEQATRSKDRTQTPLLFCRTTRAFFYADKNVNNYRPGVSLRDSKGGWVGFLSLHDEEALKALSNFNGPSSPGILQEFIAISRGYAYNHGSAGDLDEWNIGERPRDSELYEFYNVLWVEWDNEVAHRKGLGRLLKATWESEERELIDVTLG
jgi:hypothetical protein